MKKFYKEKKILIIGAAGTVGREIVRQIDSFGHAELRLVDNNESEMFFLMEEYRNKNVFCFLGDVRDRDKLEKLSKDIDIIIHTAAFKHVILSEYNPFDVVQTNIIGVENIIRAATACKVKQLLFTSSDKAVNPTNVMGTSKLMGERLITAANAVKKDGKTIFSSTRFGNVLGSRGSVVPLFMKQIREGGPVTITDKRMTRFVMTIEEAARLVLQSVLISKGGEVFVTKMPVARIPDLAEAMIKLLAPRYGYKSSDIKTVGIGAKPGEKLYEELMSDEEVHRSLELRDMFVVTPAFKSIYQSIQYEYPDTVSTQIQKSYVSENEKPLNKDELERYLIENRVLEKVEESFYGGAV
ncbi:MAG TPA: polysaccharide biosynthesis protein [Nitrospirae bacterium]|nr:UDP-N-acetylglucosamine 4,6-dehydratase [bacterium BMS3Abin06]HDH11138.1 polysaccharide biosynthesis protein [Nitrospirota bacterium]HDZ02617.1 polysaccharide biosynthesis protein [Nitrospirota bacterium]